MSLELEILEQIERYTKGELRAEELSAFEKQLGEDPSLQKHVEASLIVDEIVIAHEALKLREQMQKDLSPRKSKWPLYVTGALFLGAVGGVFYFMQSKDKAETPQTKAAKVTIEAAPSAKETTLSSVSVSKDEPSAKETKTKAVVAASKTAEVTTTASAVQTPLPERMEVPAAPAPISNVPARDKTEAVISTASKVPGATNPCLSLSGDVDFYTVPSCSGAESGELHVRQTSVKGGTAPFIFTLGERQASSAFDRLAPGTYQLVIKDAKGCSIASTKEVVIGSKQCKEKKEYTFNPDFDQSWAIPFEHGKEAKMFRIMDKGGKTFFQTAVVGNHPAEWNGESNTGLHLGLGSYFYHIEYADGTVDEGTIIVTR